MSMEEKPQFDENRNKRIEELEKERILEAKFLAEIEKDAVINAYLNQFTDYSAKSFKEALAKLKTEFELYSNNYYKNKEKRDLYFVNQAKELIWVIQQKKLFDTQCLWRAGKLEIPEVLICRDFDYWSENIKNCPFIDPITQQEVELLQQFIQSPDYEEGFLEWNDWQNYDTFKEEYLGDGNLLSMPEWYYFYNIQRGTEALLLLPDTKNELEEEYIDIGIESLTPEERDKLFDNAYDDDEIDTTMEATEDDPLPERKKHSNEEYDSRPYLFYGDEEIDKFIAQFENAEMKEIHQIKNNLYTKKDIDVWDLIELKDTMHFLKYAGENYPMQPYYCWRKGIIKLYNQFKNDKISEALPMVFEEYEMRINMGIKQHLTNKELDSINKKNKKTELYRHFYRLGKQIVEGK